jgi:signal transduction histidine kinase
MEGREVALIGRITAGMTHEIKNVLAIIKESSGLLQDILRLSKGGAVPKPEQIGKVASRIQAQVGRGDALLSSLNWLAHSMSDRSSSVEIGDLSAQIVNLMQRFARLKQVELAAQPGDRDLTIETDLPRLLLVLVNCIEYCLSTASPKGRLVLRAGGGGEEATLEIATDSLEGSETAHGSEAGGVSLPSELANLEPALTALGARLAFADPGEGGGLRIILPLRR